MKMCAICNINKPYKAFTQKASCVDGYESLCRTCRSIRYNKSSLELVVKKIYHSQKLNSVKRGHSPPNYTLTDLVEWVKQQPNWTAIYTAWIVSGYEKNLAPSIDRADSLLPYSLNSITLMTWTENRTLGRKAMKNGVDTRELKPVKATPINGGTSLEYYSIAEAIRAVNGTYWGISTVANGIPVRDGKGKLYQPKTYKGFIWSWL